MSCRIGISTEPLSRLAYWEREHPSLQNWEILGRYSNKSRAQRAETALARQHGCNAHPGGGGSEYATWYVYHFTYDPVADLRLMAY